jgi:hypothetical protein
MMSSRPTPFPGPLAFLTVMVSALVLGGCGGGSTYSYSQRDLAQRFLPTERTVEHHPDSLRALSIREKERRLQFELEEDYGALHRKWSCTYQDLGAGRAQRGRSYATFWSLELSLASLQAEMGITSLRKERARQSLLERRQEYKNALQIDVYWFESEGNSLLAGPGSRVRLRVDGEKTYKPDREDHGPLRETFLPGQTRSALYRRNTFYFSRVVDSTDILREAREVQLLINRSGASPRVRFAWSWKSGNVSKAGLHPLQGRPPATLDSRERVRHNGTPPVE